MAGGTASYVKKQHLTADDYVGFTFIIAEKIMFASTIFFAYQVFLVPPNWSGSMVLSTMVCGTAWYCYTSMKQIWIEEQYLAPQYRTADWIVTVSLQIMEFYSVIKAAGGEPTPAMAIRLQGMGFCMLVAGLLGEMQLIDIWAGWAIGCFFAAGIVYEIYFGECGRKAGCLDGGPVDPNKQLAMMNYSSGPMVSQPHGGGQYSQPVNTSPQHVIEMARRQSLQGPLGLGMQLAPQVPSGQSQFGLREVSNGSNSEAFGPSPDLKQDDEEDDGTKIPWWSKLAAANSAKIAFNGIRYILSIGWAIYPLGYALAASQPDSEQYHKVLNASYNVADLVNKTLFGLMVWYAAAYEKKNVKVVSQESQMLSKVGLRIKELVELQKMGLDVPKNLPKEGAAEDENDSQGLANLLLRLQDEDEVSVDVIDKGDDKSARRRSRSERPSRSNRSERRSKREGKKDESEQLTSMAAQLRYILAATAESK